MSAPLLDQILELQLAVAWAGESDTESPSLGWWRTSMCDEFGGEDLLQRLAPKTWRWATLETARLAAKRVDDRLRRAAEDADHLISLYRLGFELDEQLDERLLELKQREIAPTDQFPALGELMSEGSKERFEVWLQSRGGAKFTPTATGRRMQGSQPDDPALAANSLAAALLPLADSYPLPHFRVTR